MLFLYLFFKDLVVLFRDLWFGFWFCMVFFRFFKVFCCWFSFFGFIVLVLIVLSFFFVLVSYKLNFCVLVWKVFVLGIMDVILLLCFVVLFLIFFYFFFRLFNFCCKVFLFFLGFEVFRILFFVMSNFFSIGCIWVIELLNFFVLFFWCFVVG